MSQFIDIVMRFKEASEALGYTFVYGTNSVLNLIDADPESVEPETVYLLLLPVSRRPQQGSTGGINAIVAQCRFMLLAQNELDHMLTGEPIDYYFQKYENRVMPMFAQWQLLRQVFICPGIVMQDTLIDEVVNQFNSNLDGLMVTCTIRTEFGQYNSIPIVPPSPQTDEEE
jgi:hypothetical protein